MVDPLGERVRGHLEGLPDNLWLDVAWAIPFAAAFALNVAGVNDGVWFWVVLVACFVSVAVLFVQLLGRASRAAARGDLF